MCFMFVKLSTRRFAALRKASHGTGHPAWDDDLDQIVFKGKTLIEEAEFFHQKSRTLILTDFVQNYASQR